MILFLDRLPLYSWIQEQGGLTYRHWSVSLPILVTPRHGDVASALRSRVQRWVFDPAYTGEAYAWRSHLEEAGLDPTVGQRGIARSRSAFGNEERLPIRSASLWLVSNLPGLHDQPFLLPLLSGIVFRDAPAPDPEFHRPLLGVRLLLRAGLKVQTDFARATVSVWTPGSWRDSLTVTMRRLATGFARRPPGGGTWSKRCSGDGVEALRQQPLEQHVEEPHRPCRTTLNVPIPRFRVGAPELSGVPFLFPLPADLIAG